MTTSHERRKHFRGSPRPGRRVEIRFKKKGSADELTAAVTRNIGVGGAFIICDQRPPIGDIIELVLTVPNSETDIVVDGEVRWEHAGDTTPGFGVKFLSLDVEALLSLSEYFASLTVGG